MGSGGGEGRDAISALQACLLGGRLARYMWQEGDPKGIRGFIPGEEPYVPLFSRPGPRN